MVSSVFLTWKTWMPNSKDRLIIRPCNWSRLKVTLCMRVPSAVHWPYPSKIRMAWLSSTIFLIWS